MQWRQGCVTLPSLVYRRQGPTAPLCAARAPLTQAPLDLQFAQGACVLELVLAASLLPRKVLYLLAGNALHVIGALAKLGLHSPRGEG